MVVFIQWVCHWSEQNYICGMKAEAQGHKIKLQYVTQ